MELSLLRTSLHVPLDLTIIESPEAMGSALGKLCWFAESAVPGESFSVLVSW